MGEAWESEERDDRGRFSGGGGGGGGGDTAAAVAEGEAVLHGVLGNAVLAVPGELKTAGNDNAAIWANTTPQPGAYSTAALKANEMAAAYNGEEFNAQEAPGAAGLQSYTGGGYRDMNGLSRDPNYSVDGQEMYDSAKAAGIEPQYESPQAKVESLVSGLDQAIAEQNPTPADSMLYRGVANYGDEQQGGTAPTYAQLPDGTVVTDPGFVSTTTNPGFAENWSNRSEAGQVLAIHAPAGTQGIYTTTAFNSYSHEEEVVLPRNTPMEKMYYDSENDVTHMRVVV